MFRIHGIDTPDLERSPGERFLDVFEETLGALEMWIREVL